MLHQALFMEYKKLPAAENDLLMPNNIYALTKKKITRKWLSFIVSFIQLI